MKIYLVRHAQVNSNLKVINFNNENNEGLTEEGRLQARRLAQKLKRYEIDKIFTSESKRSYETIVPFLKIKNIPFQKDKRLNEANFGIFSGLTLKEAEAKYPEIYKTRLEDKYNFRIPAGETYCDVAKRLSSFFNDLKEEVFKSGRNNFLIVTHATTSKVFLIHYLNFTVQEADSIHFKNASISLFAFQKTKVKAIMINNTSYLK